MAAEAKVAVSTNALGADPDRSAQPTPLLPGEQIIEDGDMRIDCCDKSGGKFLVSSATMKRASPVFRAMLGPNFAEGQQKSLPLEVVCQEDDWTGMQLMLQLLHTQPSCVDKDELSTEDVECFARMAVIADKYQCTKVLSLAADSVLLRACSLQDQDSKDMYCFTIVAYLFNKPKYFYVITKWLVIENCKQYSHILDVYLPGIGEVLGLRFIFELDSQRTAAILQVIEEVRDMAVHPCPRMDCEEVLFSETFLTSLCDQLSASEHWPPSFRTRPIRIVLREISVAGDIEMEDMPCEHNGMPSMVGRKFGYELRRWAQATYNEIGGMCIDCVRAGSYKRGLCEETGHAQFKLGRECGL